MRALTVKQPWAALIVSGTKRVENRSWKCGEVMIGERIAIHAGLAVDDEAMRSIEIEHLVPRRPSWDTLGAIVGFVTVIGCVASRPELAQFYLSRGEREMGVRQIEWFSGPFGHVFANHDELARPIPCRGKLGYWHIPPEALSAVEIGMVV